jgi:hypothetical protein
MFNTTKIALSLALVLGTASGALAATKHPAHGHRTAAASQVPAAAYQAFDAAPVSKSPSKEYGFVGTPGTIQQPLSFRIQSYAP